MPSIAVTREEHYLLDELFNRAARGAGHDRAAIIRAAKEAYRNYPELLDIALQALGVNR